MATEDTTPFTGRPVPPLTVVGASPGAGEDGDPRDARVVVTFSNPLDTASLSDEAIRLVREGTKAATLTVRAGSLTLGTELAGSGAAPPAPPADTG